MSFFQSVQRSGKKLFLSLSQLSKLSELNYDPRRIALLLERLKEANVPVGIMEYNTKDRGRDIIQRYYFILKKHQEIATKALLQDK